MAIRRVGDQENIVLDQAQPQASLLKNKLRKLDPREDITLDADRAVLDPRATSPVYQPLQEPDTSLIGHVKAGAVDAARRLHGFGANVGDALADAADRAEYRLKTTYYDVAGYPQVDPNAPDTISAPQGNVVSNAMREMASGDMQAERELAGKLQSMNVQDTVSWEDVKQDPVSRDTGRFILEQGARSLPEMAVAFVPVVGMPAVAATTTQNVIENRNYNTGLSQTDRPKDMSTAVSAGLVSAGLERLGVLGDVPQAMGGVATKSLTRASEIPAAMAKSGAGEAATEYLQEGTEYIGGTLGTDEDVTAAGFNEAGLQGAIVGGPMGATIRGGTETAAMSYNKARQSMSGDAAPDGQTRQEMGAPPVMEQTAEASPRSGAPLVEMMLQKKREDEAAKRVEVPLGRDDLAAAINDDAPLPDRKEVVLPDVQIAPELQAQGFTVGSVAQQIDADGEVLEGRVAQAQLIDGVLEVTVIDDAGNLRTLFSSDGQITAYPYQAAQPQPEAVVAPVPAAPETTLPQPQPPAVKPPSDAERLAAMSLDELTQQLAFVRQQAMATGGWNKRTTATAKAVRDELNKRFPEWDVPARADVAEAAAEVAPQPTDAQKEAGNYKKGHVSIQGLPVTIEIVKGGIRSGTGRDGTAWQTEMPAHYGYIKRSKGADDEQVDVYIGDNPSAENVYIVDQINPDDDSFDEHKAMVGFPSLDTAIRAYQSSFSDGRGSDRMGGITTLTLPEFKAWLKKKGARRTPLAWKPKPQEQTEAAQPKNDTVRTGEVGMKLSAGEVVLTTTGRQTTPFPKLNFSTNRTSEMTEKRVSTWLMQNALDEARSRGDDFNALQFEANLAKPQKADKDSAEFYLFDPEWINVGSTQAGQENRGEQSSETQNQAEAGQSEAAKSEEGQAGSGSETSFEQNVQQPEAAEQQPPVNIPPAAEKPKKPTKTEEKKLRRQMFDLYYRMGRKIKSYGGEDFVVRYTYDPFSVTVRGVTDNRERTHSTLPDMREVRKVWAAEGQQTTQDTPAEQVPEQTKAEEKPAQEEKPTLDDTNVAETAKPEEKQQEPDVETKTTELVISESDQNPEWNMAKLGGAEAHYEANDGVISIFDLSSKNGGKGDARRLLNALKKQYGKVNAAAVIEESIPFWNKMMAEGLVSRIETAEGKKIPASETDTPASAEEKKTAEPPKKRLEDVGEKLEGGRKFKGEIDKVSASEQAKLIIESTKQSVAFAYKAPENQTQGVSRFHQELLGQVYNFSEYLYKRGVLEKGRGGRYSSKMFSWQDQVKALVSDENDGTNDIKLGDRYTASDSLAYPKKMDIINYAREYMEFANRLNDIFENSRNLQELRLEIKNALEDKDFSSALSQFTKSFWIERDIVKEDEWSTFGRIKDETEEKKKAGPEKKLIRPKLDRIEREGLTDYRNGEDVTPEKFRETFGFRGVEFGNWVNAKEGQAHVNHAFDALSDLAKRLGIRNKDISLGGKLGFAFGARGSGEHAAHFEPDTNIINLTKTKGDGSVAHEWAHALDHNIRKTGNGKAFMDAAYNSLSYSLKTREELETYVKKFLKQSIWYEGFKKDGPVANAKKFLSNMRYNVYKQAGRTTQFKREGDDLGKDYWGTQIELFARAWESWIFDTLDGKSPYLVNGWVADGVVTKKNGYRGTIYPAGDERRKFNDMYDALIKNIEFTDDGVKLKEGARLPAQDEVAAILKTAEDIESRLGQMMKEIDNGDVQQGEVSSGVSDSTGKRSTTFVPPDDAREDTQDTPEGDGGRGGDAVQTSGEVASGKAQDGRGAGKDRGDGDSVQRDDTVPAKPDIEASTEAFQATGENHVISLGDLSETRSQKQKAEENIKIIKLVKRIEAERRAATPEEQVILAKFTGWGSIKNAFPDGEGKAKDGWGDIVKEVKDILTDEEYRQSRRTIQYAHYTSEIVTRQMWEAMRRFGLTKGNIFEPGMGIGNFVGMMPQDMDLQYSGLEVDPMSARIASILYPKSGVRNADFISAQYADGMFDAAIGNPPFSETKVKGDKKYKNLSLHNYFFAKTLDMVADGGVIGFVTSRYSMDAMDADARKAIAEKADLLGAIRLPDTAFKTNAHTEVVTDIIFLRKRRKGEESNGTKWIQTKEIDLTDGEGKPFRVNEYFVNNPEMVLGDFTTAGSMYAANTLTVSPPANKDLQQQLFEAVNRLPEGVVTEIDRSATVGLDMSPAESKDGSYYLKDGVLMQVENGIGQPAPMRGKTPGGLTREDAEKVKKLIPIRDSLREALEAMVARDERAVKKAQKELRKHYDSFVKKYGPVTKSETKTRPPAPSMLEEARDERRNDYIAAGEEFNEGDIDLSGLLGKTNPDTGKKYTPSQIAKIRQDKIAEIEAKGGVVDHGDFDPSSVSDSVTITYPNMDAFKADPEYYNLIVLENYDADTDTASTTDVFEKNIVREVSKPKIQNAVDALNYSLAHKNGIDIDFMAVEAGTNRESLIRELEELDLIYGVPAIDGKDHYVYAEAYLSGLVKDKLAYAKRLAAMDKKYQRNVEALEAVQPRDIPASDINTQLGSPYLSPEVISDFMEKELNIVAKVTYSPIINSWEVSAYDRTAAENTSVHGTNKRYADDLMASLLMRREIKVTRKVEGENGEKTIVDVEETQAAQDKARAMQEKFDAWIWKSEHGEKVHRRYNAEYNNIVPRKFDGKHINVASTITPRPHQKTAVWRILQEGNTYLAHAVGAGKTLEMVMAGMEMRRLGQWKKPLYVVPNHMLAQFAGEFRAAYPQAKIMVADERNFHADKRQRFVANVAKGDWDAVIMTYSAFKKIPVSKDFEAEMIQTEIDKYRMALEEANRSKGSTRGTTAARIEKQIEKMESRIKGLKSLDLDQSFSFDQLGTDAILLDEAHYFRKLSFVTMQGNMKGVNPIGSKAAWDLYVKSKYLNTVHPGRNLVMASGTPLTNTLAEVFTIQRMMNEAALEARNIATFDAWSAVYAASVTSAERQPSGAYKNVTRLAEFRNLNSLSQMVREFMDVVTSDELGQLVDRPTMKSGTMIIKTVEPTREYLAFQKFLADRTAEVAKSGRKNEKGADNILSIINEGRHAAIDMRLVDPTLPEKRSKLEDMIDNVFKVWKETSKDEFTVLYKGDEKSKNKGGAQLIFSDLGVRSRTKDGQSFSAYEHIRRKLVRLGVPAEQIAFIADYDSTEEKRRLQAKVRSGEIRILIGSTAKMGTGLNVQNRLKAVHNLDAPWLPADLEQRTGRALRQGNQYGEVEIYGYGTEGSYDSTMWGMLETKAKAIIQFLKGDGDLTTMRDIEETDHFRMAKAMTSGDPRVLKQAELESEVEKLSRQAMNFINEQVKVKSDIASNKNRISYNKDMIGHIEDAAKKKQDLEEDKFVMSVSGTPHDERADAAEALEKSVKSVIDAGTSSDADGVKIADYRGFEVRMFASIGNAGSQYEVFINHPAFDDAGSKNVWDDKSSFSGSGAISRLNNAINRLSKRREDSESAIQRSGREIKVLESQISGDFPKQEELRKKRDELSGIEKDLKENAPVEIVYDDYPLDYWRANKAAVSGSSSDASFYILSDEEHGYEQVSAKRGTARNDNALSQEVQNKINNRLKSMGWPQAAVVVKDNLDAEFGVSNVDGAYWRGLIYVSMNAKDVIGTINHEIVHALKAFGAFTGAEWSALESRAAAWREKYNIDATYKAVLQGQGVSDPAMLEAKLNEEAIAHAFQDQQNQGIVRRLANKAVRFIKAIGAVLRGAPYNFTTAEDVFDAISSGDVAKRVDVQKISDKKQREAKEKDSKDFPAYSLSKDKGKAVEQAREVLANVRGLERNLLNDLKRVSSVVLHPHQIATLYKEFTPVYRAVIERFKQREVMIHTLSSDVSLYNNLSESSKKNVNAALEIGRLTASTFKADADGSITVKNKNLKNTLHSKDGDTITLSPAEAAAYLGVRKAMNDAMDKFMDTILEDFGLIEKGVKTVQDVEKLRLEALKKGDMQEVRRLKNILERMNEVADAKKKGYIPFKRWGNIGVSVKDSEGNVVHFERIEAKTSGFMKGKIIGEDKNVQAVYDKLLEKFNDEEYDINFFEMSKFDEVQANLDLRNLDVLAASSEMSDSDYQRLRDILEREMQAKGFRAHFFKSKDVPGYSDDFERAINDYVVTVSSYIARRMNDKKIEANISAISESGKSSLYEYAREYQQYVNDPTEELASIRMMGFFWYLAGNISSGLVNLSQPFLVTAPWFSAKFSHAQIAKQMSRAMTDAAKMINISKAGMDAFDFDAAPKDVRDALKMAYAEGDFISLATNDAMAMSNSTSQSLRGLEKKRRLIAEGIAMTFSVPEKINRVATFISAYRLALDPKNQEKIKEFVRNDYLARDMLRGKNSPEAFAFAYAELAVVSTQYRVGKLNRPKLTRSYGSLIFQFWSFMMQTFELMYKLAKVNGGQNKKALAIMILSIVAVSGLKGLPFEDDLQDLFEALFKFATGEDLDLDTKAREAIIKATGSPLVAEAIIKGLPAALMNVDLSARLGFGSVAPDSGADFLGVWWDMLYERPVRAAGYARDEEYLRALAEVSPAFIKNPLTAYLWSEDGVRTQKGTKVIDAENVTSIDAALKFLGFTSADISRERDRIYATDRASSAVDAVRSKYYRRMAKALAERRRLLREGDKDGAAEFDQALKAIKEEINSHNQTAPLHERIIINQYALKRKVMEEMRGAEARRIKKQARSRAEELKEIYGSEKKR